MIRVAVQKAVNAVAHVLQGHRSVNIRQVINIYVKLGEIHI